MQVYYATMYFVDPATICSTGRTAEEFASQGSGYMLAMQNGMAGGQVSEDAMRFGMCMSQCMMQMQNCNFEFD